MFAFRRATYIYFSYFFVFWDCTKVKIAGMVYFIFNVTGFSRQCPPPDVRFLAQLLHSNKIFVSIFRSFPLLYLYGGNWKQQQDIRIKITVIM